MIIKSHDKELKVCPFCGGKPIIEVFEMSPYERNNFDSIDGMYYEVWCDSCQAPGPTCLTEKEAMENWNNRI